MIENTENVGLDYGAAGAGGDIVFVPLPADTSIILPADTTIIGTPQSADYSVNYEIVFASNFDNEIEAGNTPEMSGHDALEKWQSDQKQAPFESDELTRIKSLSGI